VKLSKKTKVAFLLALSLAGPVVAGRRGASSPTHSASAQASQKVIKDPAEYNSYMTALNTQDPTAKATAMEAFAKQFPQSIVMLDALEQAMAAYQQAGNIAKVQEVADEILQLDHNNIRALAIAAHIKRSQGTPQAAAEVGVLAQRGLQLLPGWQKPEEMKGADFKQLHDQVTVIFAGAAGFASLQTKQYALARDYYLKSLQVDPNNTADIYQLGIADLEMNPLDVRGFWYIAKAINLTRGNEAGQQQIDSYGKAKYKKYHGSAEGWEQLLASAGTQSALPGDFAVKPAPTPAELAVEAVQQNDPGSLSFSDWGFILSYRDASPANKDAADKVWETIQEKQRHGEARLRLNGVKVISAEASVIHAALDEDNQQNNRADLLVNMETPLPNPPAAGAMIDIVGVITSYTLEPFAFIMDKGELPRPKPLPQKPRPAPHSPAPHPTPH
jgi:tetratricopeptide (TPR) repeat protein